MPATSAPSIEATNLPPSVKAELKVETGPGQIPARRAYLTAGTNRFAFLVPEDFRLDASDPQKVTVVSPDNTKVLTVRILGPMPPETWELQAATYRELLLERNPDVQIREEFSLTAAGRRGPAFDLQWSTSTGGQQACRIAFIPSNAGVLEFSLLTSRELFAQAQPSLYLIMLTFRASDAKGRLDIAPLSDKL
jgi:hypothetical protein